MTVDGFTEAEISSFITNGPPKVTAPAPVAPAAPAVDERYEKFVKMRKMLPEGAVRQKMALEGFTEAEIDSFIANGPPKAAAPAPAPAAAAVEERFEKFVKMRKMLPEGAVRQKMAMEGFTEAEINLFIANGPPVAAASASTAPAAAPAAEKAPECGERATKFIKMKTMLPEGAVRQKMAMEGFTPSEIDVFFGAAPGTGAAAAPKGPTFTPLEAIRFAKYEKLMKTTPADQVRQKMETEEVSAEDIEKFFAVMAAQAAAKAGGAKGGAGAAPKAAPVEPPPDGMPAKPKITPVAKMKGVFWNKLKNNSIKGTVWYKLPEYNLPADEIKRLEDLFGTKTVAPEVLEAKAAKAKEKSEKKLLSLLDAQRTQNMLIVMGKVRKSPQDIMKLVLDLDPATLHPELTHTLYELHPSPDGKLVLV
jgi:predicted transcriptional regulator